MHEPVVTMSPALRPRDASGGALASMLAVFVHIRAVLFGRLDAALREGRWADGASALDAIRWEVSANLVLGAFVTVMVRLGGTA